MQDPESVIVIYTSDLPAESLVGSIVKSIYPGTIHKYDKPDNLRKLTKIEGGDLVILFGNFFQNLDDQGCNHIPFGSNFPPLTALFNLLENEDYIDKTNIQTRLFFNSNREVFQLLEKRIMSIDNNSTQPFFTGLFNYLADKYDNSVEGLGNKFLSVLSGEITVSELSKHGSIILTSQIQLTYERARRNSKRGTLQNGKTYMVTNSPDLINLSHDSLYNFSEDRPDITIAVSLKFSNNDTDKIHYSMRSYDEETDVAEIIKNNTEWDGFKKSAGGTKEIDIMLNSFV